MNIVSANYRDRRSSIKWLIREEGQDPNKAQAVTSITATGVAFCPSSDYERGFGCSVVAFCKTAVVNPSDVPLGSDAVRIRHTGFGMFYNEDTGQEVRACDRLILRSDGSMYMATNPVVATSEPKTADSRVAVPA